MSELATINTSTQPQVGEIFFKTLSHMDSKSLLIGGSIVCVSATICIACICFSGSEMNLSRNGLSISRPNNSIPKSS